METKKLNKLILIILLVVIVIVGVIVISKVINNQKVEEVKRLIEKTASYNNYYYETKNASNQTIIVRVKDNVVLENFVNTVIWKNHNTNECVVLDNNNNKKNAIVFENTDDFIRGEKIYPLSNEYFNETKYKIKYVGKEELDGKKCLIIEYTDKKDNTKQKIWFDEETGIYYKWKSYSKDGSLLAEQSYKVNLNTLTDDDVKKPDMTGYNIVKPDENKNT